MKTRTSKYIKTKHGVYERAAETKDNVYFICYTTDEDSLRVLMYDRLFQLKSEGKEAFTSFKKDKNKFTWSSKKFKESLVRRK